MELENFSAILDWLLRHGYLIMFLGMAVEGPFVTAAAAFAVALGHFNFFLVYLLSLLGDVIPDLIYYAAGYWGGAPLVRRYGRFVGLTEARHETFSRAFARHAVKAIIVLKLVPFIATPGLAAAGLTRVPPKKFIATDLLFAVPHSLFFMLIGFYFGQAFDAISHTIADIRFALLVIIPFLLLAYLLYKTVAARVARTIKGMEEIAPR